ncbi:Pumilio like 23 [Apostasia shenzhenica]|uniref:Pumilio like 23 n=1 Tax=Apostasia shenzhenica TaxID=1088818 RepID=A0A2I0B0Z9_9ASPA|nr:Pumilio like 23 [Apostasia shenzhenica]
MMAKWSKEENTSRKRDTNNSQKRDRSNNKKKKHKRTHFDNDDDGSSKQMGIKKLKNKNKSREILGATTDSFSDKSFEKLRAEKSLMEDSPSRGHATPLRKRIDPDTAKYFSEIANLFESNDVDMEVRPTICGNALEESKGKELELATDMIISRILQCLLEGCELEQLCAFISSSAEVFPLIAVDKFGSHVAETAIKSLTMHLQDGQSDIMVEETLHRICQVIVADAVNVMCSRYGSHVVRSLLCSCKGVPLDALEEFHVTKASSTLAERLNLMTPQPEKSILKNLQNSFPDTFKFLVHEILMHVKDEMTTLRVDKHSSFVFQSMLKLLVGDEEELLHASLVLLGCQRVSFVENKFTEASKEKLKQDVMGLLEDTASSHLLEVIVEVAPVALYAELLDVVFKGSLFDMSSHQLGNFVVQALVSSARTKDQATLFVEELGPHLGQLFEAGKPGVVASILAACQRLHTHIDEFCEALTTALCPQSKATTCIVPHLLFLDSYFREKTDWKWPIGHKMHILGCLMLQNLYKISQDSVRPFIESITSMEAVHVLETARDVGGSRVLEAFLSSSTSIKQKDEVLAKLQGHFGELSMQPSGSFAVEKCFAASNISMKETIALEVLNVQPELSRTRHGPFLLRKLDIEGFASHPDRWKSSRASKVMAYQEFLRTFGSEDQSTLAPESCRPKKKLKIQEKMASNADSGNSGEPVPPESQGNTSQGSRTAAVKSGKKFLRHSMKSKPSQDSETLKVKSGKNFVRHSTKSKPYMETVKKKKKKTASTSSELADLAGKSKLSQGDFRKLFDPKTLSNKKKKW